MDQGEEHEPGTEQDDASWESDHQALEGINTSQVTFQILSILIHRLLVLMPSNLQNFISKCLLYAIIIGKKFNNINFLKTCFIVVV